MDLNFLLLLNKRTPIPIILVLFISLIQLSCGKGNDPVGIITSENPPPQIFAGRDQVLSSVQDTTVLTGSSNTADVIEAGKYKFKWTCIDFPDGAPMPRITNPSGMETTVYGMKPGDYVFKVEISNKKGTKTDEVKVTVVQDTLSGNTVVIDNLYWNVVSKPLFPGAQVAKIIDVDVQTISERPDLFFRKSYSMAIAYRHEGTTNWVPALDFSVETIGYRLLRIFKKDVGNEWLDLNVKGVSLRISFL